MYLSQSMFYGKFITAHFDRKSWTPISERPFLPKKFYLSIYPAKFPNDLFCHCTNSLSSLYISIHHYTFCASLHVKTSPAFILHGAKLLAFTLASRLVVCVRTTERSEQLRNDLQILVMR